MKLLIAVALVVLVGSVVAEEFVAPIELDYHNKIGIPKAARLKAAEEAAQFDGSRIVGGSPSSLGQNPYLGGIVISLNGGLTSMCGCTLLSNTRAVTAAHCWRTANNQAYQFELVFASTLLFYGGTRIITSNVEMHANYNVNTIHNDIAMVSHNWVTYNNNIRNIPIATGSNQFVGTWAWASGFGKVSDYDGMTMNQYQAHVQVQVISNSVCQQTFGSTVQSTTLCIATTGGRGTCDGDSGGPLVANNQLIGVTSFSHVHGCQVGFPAGFARVTSFASWIQARM